MKRDFELSLAFENGTRASSNPYNTRERRVPFQSYKNLLLDLPIYLDIADQPAQTVYEDLVAVLGGVLCRQPADAQFLVTDLQNPNIFDEAREAESVVVDVQWLRDCVAQRKKLDYTAYCIMSPD